MSFRIATACLALLLTSCPGGEKSPIHRSVVSEIALPADLLAPKEGAVAYRVGGPKGERIDGVRLPLTSGVRGRGETGDLLLLRRSERGYRPIAHRIGRDAVFADLVPGDYVLVPRPTGQLAKSLDLLCRFVPPKVRVPRLEIPEICTRILCGGEPFRGADLGGHYGVSLPGDLAGREFGGWTGPTDWCRECTRPRPGDVDIELPGLSCRRIEDVCETGVPLLSADFEADTVGQPPSTSPMGPPADDVLSFAGEVRVVGGATNKAVEIDRAGASSLPPNDFTRLVGTLGTGADGSGRVCVAFRLGPRAVSSPLLVSLQSPSGQEAWRMVVDQGNASIVGNGSPALLSNFGITTTHDVRFDIDMDAAVFDASVDGGRVLTGQPFRDTGFDVPAHLQFRYLPTIVEAFSGRAMIDDLEVRKGS